MTTTFRGSTGVQLAGRLELPSGPQRGVALVAHCFTCSKDLSGLVRIARALASRGYAVLRFDFTGLGESEGSLAEGHFAANVGDLVAAAEHLRESVGAPTLLVGHSLGGAASLLAAGQIPSLRAVATVGAPAEPSHVLRLFTADTAEIEAEGSAEVSIAGRRFRITREFLAALDQGSMREAIGALRRALLVIHAPRDATVGIDNASAIFKAAKHPKSFVSLDDADHLLTRPADARYVGEVIATWAERYLDPPRPEARIELRGASVAASIGRDRYRTRMVTGEHAWVADEPVKVGGGELGPNPFDMVNAGLAACTSMTLRMYADRKNWPLEGVTTRVSYEQVAPPTGSASGERSGRFDRRVELSGELDEGKRARLIQIANKCPVHRLLSVANAVVGSAEPVGEG